VPPSSAAGRPRSTTRGAKASEFQRSDGVDVVAAFVLAAALTLCVLVWAAIAFAVLSVV
jgi:hypothetical protein